MEEEENWVAPLLEQWDIPFEAPWQLAVGETSYEWLPPEHVPSSSPKALESLAEVAGLVEWDSWKESALPW